MDPFVNGSQLTLILLPAFHFLFVLAKLILFFIFEAVSSCCGRALSFVCVCTCILKWWQVGSKKLNSYVCVCLSPSRSPGWNFISLLFFCQYKQLCLANCTNCFKPWWLPYSNAKYWILRLPFSVISTCDVWIVPTTCNTKYTWPRSTCKATLARFFQWLQSLNCTIIFTLVSSTPSL